MSENVAFRVHSDVFSSPILQRNNPQSVPRPPPERQNPIDSPPPSPPRDSISSLFSLMEMVHSLDNIPTIGIRHTQSRRIITRRIISSIERDTIQESLETGRQLRRSNNTKIILSPQKYDDLDKAKYANECSICVEEFKTGDEVGVLDCNHLFHHKCILEWGHYNVVCPICREKIPSIEEEEEEDEDEIEME